MDADLLALNAEITNLEKNAQNWEMVHFVISTFKLKGKNKEPLTELNNPDYYLIDRLEYV